MGLLLPADQRMGDKLSEVRALKQVPVKNVRYLLGFGLLAARGGPNRRRALLSSTSEAGGGQRRKASHFPPTGSVEYSPMD
jgi:hypothetical protein